MSTLAATKLLEHVQAALAEPATCATPLAQAQRLLHLLAPLPQAKQPADANGASENGWLRSASAGAQSADQVSLIA